jgi:quinol monooxygenase YgiN
MVTDIFILPEKLDEYVKIVTPVVKEMRAMPECLWCGISQDPQDPSHIRIQHAWTEGTEWFTSVSISCVLFLQP